MSARNAAGTWPDWEHVLSAAARPQELLPGAVLVGGTAAGLHAGHRTSRDADHVLTDLRSHFDAVLGQLEARWHDWDAIRAVCVHASTVIFDHVCDLDEPDPPRSE